MWVPGSGFAVTAAWDRGLTSCNELTKMLGSESIKIKTGHRPHLRSPEEKKRKKEKKRKTKALACIQPLLKHAGKTDHANIGSRSILY